MPEKQHQAEDQHAHAQGYHGIAPVDRFGLPHECRVWDAATARFQRLICSNHRASRRVPWLRPGVVVGAYDAIVSSLLLRRSARRPGLRPAACLDAGPSPIARRASPIPCRSAGPRPATGRLAVRHPDRLPHVGLASRAGRQGALEWRLPRRPARRSGRGAVVRAWPADRSLRRHLSRRQARGRRATTSGTTTVSFEGSYANDVPQGRGTLRIDDVVLSGEWSKGCLATAGKVVAIGVPRVVRSGRQADTEDCRPLVSTATDGPEARRSS